MIPSVTEVIREVGEHWLNFSHVSSERLEFAQSRGTDFHRLAALYATGSWIDEIPDSCAGFFASFCAWFDEFVEKVILVEKSLVHPVLNYKGTPDLIARIKGENVLTLVDHKTPRVFSKSWRLQLSAYQGLAGKNGYPVLRVASLQPHPDGGPARFEEYTKSLTADFAVFLAKLTVWRFYNG